MKRLLFFHQGGFSHINRCVLAGLQAELPDVEIRTVDLHALVKARIGPLVRNGLAACWHYGGDLLLRRRDLDDAFYGTRFLFRYVRELALQVHREWPADCSFQTQSMFDCSTTGVPHFVYTDHTYASCRAYPAYGKHIWAPARRAWLMDLERSVYDHAACMFTMSSNVSTDLLEYYGLPAERVFCVRAGCNAAAERLATIELKPARYQRKRILFVGVEWERKGGPQLVQAFERVRARHPEATLVIVGVTPHVAGPGIEVVGRVPVEQVAAYYADATLFCLPSQLEPFGIAYLEALAAGLPVVALRLGAAPDFVIPGQTGALVSAGDADALARSLMDLLDDPAACQRLGTAARALVTDRYRWDRTCAAMTVRMRQRFAARRTVIDSEAQSAAYGVRSNAPMSNAAPCGRATLSKSTERFSP